MTRRTRDRLLFACALAVHVAVLYAPSSGAAPAVPHLDKVIHVAIFAAVAFTGVRAGIPVVALGLALAAHAGLSEWVQGALLADRSADAWDAVADLVGAVLGLVLGALVPSGGRGDRRTALDTTATGRESMGA